MVELEEEIKEIKKEIIDARNLIIKTDNLVKNLSADIKAIHRKQETYERKGIINSVAAYVIFVALIGTGAYFLIQSRVEKLQSENQTLLSKESTLKSRITELDNRLSAKVRASKQALQVYERLKRGTSEEAVAQFDQLIGRGLSKLERALLGEIVAKKRIGLARIKYEEGLREVKRKNDGKAEKALRSAIRYLGKTKDSMLTDLYYELGTVLHRMKKYAESTEYLSRMLRRSTDKKRNGEVSYTIARNFELSAQLDKAKNAYLKFLQLYPRHKWSKMARYRLRKLQ